MSKLMIVLTAILTFAAVGFAQTTTEIETLRKQINIPAADIIRQNEDAKLPAGNSLKIFLAIKREGDEAKYFDKWVKEWNKKEAAKNGRLEVTQNISEADTVLVQFVVPTGKIIGESAVGVKTVPDYGRINGGTVESNTKVYSENGIKSLNLPVYSYLLKREDDLWTIIYSDVETSLNGEQITNPELNLWRTFKEEMKAR